MEENLFFKTRKEVEQFFNDTVFEFYFISDGIMEFKNIIPLNIFGGYYDFTLSFFYNEGDFFRYSRMQGNEDWLNKFQLFEVYKTELGDSEAELMYHEKYNGLEQLN